MFKFNDVEDLKHFVQKEILGSSEAIILLGITRARLSKLKTDGRIIPIKELPRDALYLKSDLRKLKKELEGGRKKYRPYDE